LKYIKGSQFALLTVTFSYYINHKTNADLEMTPPKEHDNDVVENTINDIRGAGLRYPAFPLLCCFIEQAKKPQVAAAYAKKRMDAGELYLMVSDWVYIVECRQSCSVSVFWDPH
jgi:hypothetical protein